MRKFLTLLLTLAILTLSTGCAISKEKDDLDIVKQRAEIIVTPDMTGAEALKWIIVYDEAGNPTGLLMYDKYGNQVLSIGEIVGR